MEFHRKRLDKLIYVQSGTAFSLNKIESRQKYNSLKPGHKRSDKELKVCVTFASERTYLRPLKRLRKTHQN